MVNGTNQESSSPDALQTGIGSSSVALSATGSSTISRRSPWAARASAAGEPDCRGWVHTSVSWALNVTRYV